MKKRKFIWVGYNQTLKKYQASEPMDTIDVLTGNYPQFFSIENRYEGGSCLFLGEVYKLDWLYFKLESGERFKYMLDTDGNGKMMLLGEEQKMTVADMLARTDIAELTFSSLV